MPPAARPSGLEARPQPRPGHCRGAACIRWGSASSAEPTGGTDAGGAYFTWLMTLRSRAAWEADSPASLDRGTAGNSPRLPSSMTGRMLSAWMGTSRARHTCNCFRSTGNSLCLYASSADATLASSGMAQAMAAPIPELAPVTRATFPIYSRIDHRPPSLTGRSAAPRSCGGAAAPGPPRLPPVR
jgi:hypothetical protein